MKRSKNLSDFSRRLRRLACPLAISCVLAGWPALAQSVNTIVSINDPEGLAIDAAGTFYVASRALSTISKVAPGMPITTFVCGINQARDLVFDRAGNLYVVRTDANSNALTSASILKIAPNGAMTTFAAQVGGPLAVDANDNIYGVALTSLVTLTVKKISPAGVVSDFASLTGLSIAGLAFDSAGNLAAAVPATNFSTIHIGPAIIKISPSGAKTTFAGGNLLDKTPIGPILPDGNGNIYIAAPGALTRFAPDGTSSVTVSSGQFQRPAGIVYDRAGNPTVADSGANALLQVVFSPSPLVSAILPGSRSVQVGTPATVFATIINGGRNNLGGCQPLLTPSAAGAVALDYQTTDPATNKVTGTANAPATLAAGASQSFVLAFKATAPFSAGALPLVYQCSGVTQAPNTPGVNTIDLLFSAIPVPDIIAQSATLSHDGIVTVPLSQNQGSAFAVATSNVGIAAPIVVSADTGGATLPLTAQVCQSNPANAQCLQPPAQSIQVNFPAGATSTFSIFVRASAPVDFVPETSRIFARFNGTDGMSHGSTSVAVRTQ